LCKRFNIDLTSRNYHGALLDSQLTAQVYQELLGGRQKKLLLSPQDEAAAVVITEVRVARVRPEPLAPRVTEIEIAAHTVFVEKELKEAVWNWT
jgi:DNA polymerase-3 subunit epsilon